MIVVDHLAHLESDAAAMAELFESRTSTAAVPACPGWTVADLVRHLGQVHRWARHLVGGGEPEFERARGPADDAELAAWFRSGAGDLIGTLRGTDPSTPCWTFAGDRGEARFWRRRQALETVLHRADLQVAHGIVPEIDPALALDGIDEVVTILYPRQVRLGRSRAVPAVTIRAGGREWILGDGAPVGTVEGTAQAVLLALWHRDTPTDPGLSVSPGAAGSLTAPITP